MKESKITDDSMDEEWQEVKSKESQITLKKNAICKYILNQDF